MEGSGWVSDECIPDLVNLRLRELNISKCSVTIAGFATILQNSRNLRILEGDIPFIDALEYQDEINQMRLPPHKRFKIENFQVGR